MIKLNFCKFKISFAMLLFRLKRYTKVKSTYKKAWCCIQPYKNLRYFRDECINYITFINGIPICFILYFNSQWGVPKYFGISIYVKKTIHEYAITRRRNWKSNSTDYYTWSAINTRNFTQSIKTNQIIISQEESCKEYLLRNIKGLYNYINNTNSSEQSTVYYRQNIPSLHIDHYFYYGIWFRSDTKFYPKYSDLNYTFFIKNKLYLEASIVDFIRLNSVYNCEITIYYRSFKYSLKFTDSRDLLYPSVNNILTLIDNYIKLEGNQTTPNLKEIKNIEYGTRN